jgi:DMSO/TMAO reductase YedYZ molybdopterin-dependent catalytic subunit
MLNFLLDARENRGGFGNPAGETLYLKLPAELGAFYREREMEILKLDLAKAEPDTPTEEGMRFQIALLSGIATTAISLTARFGFDAPLLPELLAQAIFSILPISLIALVVGFFGLFAKHLAFLACVLIYLAALTVATYYFLRFYKEDRSARRQTILLAGLLLVIWFVTMLVVVPLLNGGIFGRYLRQGAIYSSLSWFVVALFHSLIIYSITDLYRRKTDKVRANNYRFSRRRVLRGVGFTVLAVGVYDISLSLIKTWFQFTSGRVKNGDGNFPNIDGLALEITPTEDFYQVSKNPFDPELSAQGWQLEVFGSVETPLTFTYDLVTRLAFVEQYATLACIDNPVGGNLIGTALWRGVPLKDLLDRVSVEDGVVDIVFHAADGYSDSIPLERAMKDGTILVYQMNGEPLTPTHGFPLRLLVPGIFGMKNVKWITRIEAVKYDFKGYWQKRGWDDRAEYKTMSRIDIPESTVRESSIIAGVAFAGDRGIRRVEVSTDGGKSWEPAELKPALSEYSWSLWHREWSPQQAGQYNLRVRATDGRGEVQTSQPAPPDPSGATGLHSVKVTRE